MATITNYIKWATNTTELKEQLMSGTGEIVAMKEAVEKTARALGGEGLFKAANQSTAAVMELGGASKLTAAEKERLNAQLEKAIEKYRVMGKEPPEAMRRLAEETRTVQETTTTAASATEQFQKSWASFAAAGAAALVSIKNLTGQVQGWLKESSAAENSTKQLTVALQAQGTFTPKLGAQYADLASKFQKTTVFADDLITEMQALLVQVGDVAPGQMEAALTAATDLAAGLGIDLRTATMLVGKAFAGETGTLARYGIVIDQSRLKTEGISVVMEALHGKFGGQAQAQITTYSGKMAVLGNQYSDVKERAGQLLAQAIIPILEKFLALPPSVQTVISVGALLIGVLGPLALAFAGITTAISLLMPLVAVALPAAMTALGVLMGPAGLIVLAIVGIVAAWKNWDVIVGFVTNVYLAVKEWLVDKFAAIVANIKAKIDAVTGFFKDMYDKVVGRSIVPDLIHGIETEFNRLQGVMVDPTSMATTKTSGLFDKMSDSLTGILDKLMSGDGKLSRILKHFLGEGGILRGLVDRGLEWVENIFGRIFGDRLPEISSASVQTLTGIFSSFFGGGGSLRDLIGQVMDWVVEHFEGGWATVLERIGNMILKFVNWVKNIFTSSFWQKIFGWLAKLFGLGGGGSGGDGLGIGGAFHAGGIVGHHGVVADTVPILAQTGEGVLSRRGMAAFDRLNQGQSDVDHAAGSPTLDAAMARLERMMDRRDRARQRNMEKALFLAARDGALQQRRGRR